MNNFTKAACSLVAMLAAAASLEASGQGMKIINTYGDREVWITTYKDKFVWVTSMELSGTGGKVCDTTGNNYDNRGKPVFVRQNAKDPNNCFIDWK